MYTDTDGRLVITTDTGQEWERRVFDEHAKLCERFNQKIENLKAQNTNTSRKYNQTHTMEGLYDYLNINTNQEIPITISRTYGDKDWEGNRKVNILREFRESKPMQHPNDKQFD